MTFIIIDVDEHLIIVRGGDRENPFIAFLWQRKGDSFFMAVNYSDGNAEGSLPPGNLFPEGISLRLEPWGARIITIKEGGGRRDIDL